MESWKSCCSNASCSGLASAVFVIPLCLNLGSKQYLVTAGSSQRAGRRLFSKNQMLRWGKIVGLNTFQ